MSIISAHMVSISDTREIQLSVMGNAFTRTTPITPHVFTILGTKSFFPVTAAFCINFHWRVIANNPINDAIAKRIKLWIMILGIFLAWILWFNRQNMERDRERECGENLYVPFIEVTIDQPASSNECGWWLFRKYRSINMSQPEEFIGGNNLLKADKLHANAIQIHTHTNKTANSWTEGWMHHKAFYTIISLKYGHFGHIYRRPNWWNSKLQFVDIYYVTQIPCSKYIHSEISWK